MKKNLEKSTNKLKMLAALVDQFLQEEIRQEDLLSNPDKVDQYRTLLWENLLGGSSDKSQWRSFSDLEKIAKWRLKNPNIWDYAESLYPEDIKKVADSIVYLHRLLKSFWDDYKEKVKIFNKLRAQWENPIRTGRDDLYDSLMMILARTNATVTQRKHPTEIKGTFMMFDYFTGKVYREGAVIVFGNLLENISADDLRICKDESCGRWFVVTSKHKRDYCSPKCAKKNAEMNQRRKDPEKYNKYHRKYYHEHISKKKKEGTESISGD